MSWTYDAVKKGYANLWAKAKLNEGKQATSALIVARKLLKSQARYEGVAKVIGCPWWFVAVAHQMEGAGSFATYLGNGQSLAHVTTIEPIGRGPFKTFEAGALDALRLQKAQLVKSWEIPRCLYEWERFNGFGYVSKGINSPYVWSYTNLYTRGKYVADHEYDASAVSTQCGAAAIFLALIQLGVIPEEVTNMSDLQTALAPFEKLAPTLITALAGPTAGLAVRVLAEIVSANNDPVAVRDVINLKPITDLKTLLRSAEAEMIDILGDLSEPAPVSSPVRAADAVTPADTGPLVVQPVKPEPSALDKATGGWLTGWKTVGGIAIYCAASIAVSLGYLTPEIGNAIMTAGGGLAGVGVIAKIERWLPLFAGFLKIRKTL